MKRFLKWAGIGLLVLLLSGGLLFVNVWYFKPVSIDAFYARVFLKFSLQQPEMLTSMRLLDPLGIRGHNARFSDSSPAAELEQLAYWQQEYETFRRYDRADYSGQALLSFDVFDFFMGNSLADAGRWRLHGFPVNQMFGIQSGLPNFMTQQHVIEDELGAEHYIARLEQFDGKFGQVLEGLREREAAGVLPPNFAVVKVIEQIEGFLEPAPDQHLLVLNFDEKAAKIDPAELGTERRAELRQRVSPPSNPRSTRPTATC